jgi:hypothetical protein
MLRAQAVLILGTLVVATGYALYLPVVFAPTPVKDPVGDPALVEACAPYLPDGVSLDTRFSRFEVCGNETVTVRERLMELAAYPEAGTICAWDGSPIYLHTPVYHWQSPTEAGPFLESYREEQAQIDTLRRRGIVILLYPQRESFASGRRDFIQAMLGTSSPPR